MDKDRSNCHGSFCLALSVHFITFARLNSEKREMIQSVPQRQVFSFPSMQCRPIAVQKNVAIPACFRSNPIPGRLHLLVRCNRCEVRG